MIMSENLNESPVIRRNEEYIERLEKRRKKLRDRLDSYIMHWGDDGEYYRHRTTNRRMSKEKYMKLRHDYYELHRKLREVETIENEKVVSKIVPLVTAYIVMDKKRNPDLYPNWLSLKIEDKLYGNRIKIQPYIDIEKLLEEKGNLHRITHTFSRIDRFVKRYFTGAATLEMSPQVFLGIDDYIKNVFKKEIRPRIVREVQNSECIHSIVFRVRGDYRKDIQIHPRFKSDCMWSSRSQIRLAIRKILEEYGWVRHDNYTDDTSRY